MFNPRTLNQIKESYSKLLIKNFNNFFKFIKENF